MHVAAAATLDGDAIVMFDLSSEVGVKSWSPMMRALRHPPHYCLNQILRHLPLLELVTVRSCFGR